MRPAPTHTVVALHGHPVQQREGLEEQPDGAQAEAAVEMRGGNQEAPATRRDLASVETSLTRDIANLRNELRQDIAELRTHAVRQEVRDQFESCWQDITREMKALVAEMKSLRREMRTIKWMLAAAFAMMALMATGFIALALR